MPPDGRQESQVDAMWYHDGSAMCRRHSCSSVVQQTTVTNGQYIMYSTVVHVLLSMGQALVLSSRSKLALFAHFELLF